MSNLEALTNEELLATYCENLKKWRRLECRYWIAEGLIPDSLGCLGNTRRKINRDNPFARPTSEAAEMCVDAMTVIELRKAAGRWT